MTATLTVNPRATTPTPRRSSDQRLAALRRANHVRARRKDLKLGLRGGAVVVNDLLRDPPAEIATMKVFDLLLTTPKYGRVRVNKILTQCRISPSKTIGGLTERQRDEIVRMLRR
jgi:hypothetical protein